MCTAVAVLLPPAVGAAAYLSAGVGNSSCGTWVSDRRHPNGADALMDESWVLGFLSGIGFEAGPELSPLRGTDPNGVWAWVDNYCSANPLKDIAEAAAAFRFAHPR